MLFLISFINLRTNYLGARTDIHVTESIHMEGETNEDRTEIDTMVEESKMQYYQVFHSENNINNSCGMLIGVGMLILPLLYSFYIGIDYKSKAIRNKIASSSLSRVLLRKFLVLSISLAAIIGAYILIIGFLGHKILWNYYLKDLDNMKQTVSQYTISENIKIILLTYVFLLFGCLLCSLFTVAFKSTSAGIIATIAINYISTPWKYDVFNIFKSLIIRNIRVYPASTFRFTLAENSQLSNGFQGILLTATYFFVLFAVFFILGKRQRN